jgi:glycosyltransferase involved in cell wall biosynthesis
LAALADKPDAAEGVSHVAEFCRGVEVAPVRRRRPLAHLPGLLRYALAGTPLELKFRHSEELVHKIQRLASAVRFDIVQIHHSEMALYLEALPRELDCKSVLMLHNIAFHQFDRIFRVERRPLRKMRALMHSLSMRRWEPRYAERFDRCIAVSEVDRQRLTAANPHVQVDVIPTGVDTQRFRPLPRRGKTPALLFIGKMSYAPCVDAVLYFCREILPLIRRAIGDVEMWVVGTDPPPEVRRLADDRVHVTGRVPDAVPYYRRSTVCVVPLRAGGGTRLKIFEAMALGRPLVSTTLGCEGLDVIDGEHLLIADRPDHFAEQTVRLLADRALYQRIVASARRLVVDHYDWDVVAKRLMEIYAEMVE